MPTTLAERLKEVRKAAGYGGPRRAAAFARKLGIKPPSLHDLESGKSSKLGDSLPGYIRIGANPLYILDGKGPKMLRDIERTLRAQSMVSELLELEERQVAMIEEMIHTLIRARPQPSINDPYKQDPPKDDGPPR